ncbi:hypothetical protein Tco_0179319 [Tanacetum coccineum]
MESGSTLEDFGRDDIGRSNHGVLDGNVVKGLVPRPRKIGSGELCNKNKVSFLSFSGDKAEKVSDMELRAFLGAPKTYINDIISVITWVVRWMGVGVVVANLAVKGVMIDGEWVDDPSKVKDEFRDYFASRFCDPGIRHGVIHFNFPNRLNIDQSGELEATISRDEDCLS